MKKIYNSPAIETLEVRSTFAICESSLGGDKGKEEPGHDPFNHAPRRRPF